MKDLKELQEKSTIENIQLEIETGLADLAQKMQKFNDEVADWDDDNQKVLFIPGSLDEDGHLNREHSLKSRLQIRSWSIMGHDSQSSGLKTSQKLFKAEWRGRWMFLTFSHCRTMIVRTSLVCGTIGQFINYFILVYPS